MDNEYAQQSLLNRPETHEARKSGNLSNFYEILWAAVYFLKFRRLGLAGGNRGELDVGSPNAHPV